MYKADLIEDGKKFLIEKMQENFPENEIAYIV